MLNGEKVQRLRTSRGWTYKETAERVRAEGAAHVRYQHIQQLEQFPSRVPRFLLQLAAAFGMTAEEFQEWEPGADRIPDPKPSMSVREPSPAYPPDLANEVRQLSLALLIIGDWIHETRPVEAPHLARALEAAAGKLGVDPKESHLGMLIQAVSGAGPTARGRAARKA